MKQIIISVH